MLARRPFARQAMPERKPLAWPGVQAFAASPRADMGNPITAQPKTEAVRSEAYRRLVAAMPCKACHIEGYSQAAHLPPDAKGAKQDDRLIFPLCCTRPGITGCHVDYDRYRMHPHELAIAIGLAWAMATMQEIIAAGDWPKNLPKLSLDQ
ncbi:MAG: hypothetical protein ACK5A0_10770 [Polaromonas sp.]|jgi:hypothetical protein